MGQSIRDIPQRLRGWAWALPGGLWHRDDAGAILMGVTIDAQGLDNAFRIMAVISMLSGLLSWKLMNIPQKLEEDRRKCVECYKTLVLIERRVL